MDIFTDLYNSSITLDYLQLLINLNSLTILIDHYSIKNKIKMII